MQPNVKILKSTSNKKKIEEKLIKRKYKRSLKGLLFFLLRGIVFLMVDCTIIEVVFCVGLFSVTESDC